MMSETMAGLPEPLTKPECDLRDYEWMPLDINRLLTSETWILGSADECKAALTLWCEAWRQVPAGSLPGDDRMLAFLSRAGAAWSGVRECVLRSWVRCSDDRIYHPVVAEKAREAGDMKLRQRERTRAATEARKHRAKSSPSDVPPPTSERDDDDTSIVKPDDTSTSRSTLRSPPDQTRTEKKERTSSLRSDGAADAPPEPSGMDEKTALWVEGKRILAKLLKRREAACGELVGKIVRDVGKDYSLALEILRAAEAECPAEVMPWIGGAIRARKNSPQKAALSPMPCCNDPAEAWYPLADKLPDGSPKIEVRTRYGRTIAHPLVAGSYLDGVADKVAEIAHLPSNWRGDWQTLCAWLRAGIEPEDVYDVVARIASRPGYTTPGKLAYFDAAVRQAGAA